MVALRYEMIALLLYLTEAYPLKHIPAIIELGTFPAIVDILSSPVTSPNHRAQTLNLVQNITLAGEEYRQLVQISEIFSKLLAVYRYAPRELMRILIETNFRIYSQSDLIVLFPLIFDELYSTDQSQSDALSFKQRCYLFLFCLLEIKEPHINPPSVMLQMDVIFNLLKILETEIRDRLQRYSIDIFHRILVENSCQIPFEVLAMVLQGFASLLLKISNDPFRLRKRSNLARICPCLSKIMTTCLDADLHSQTLLGAHLPPYPHSQMIMDSGLMTIILGRLSDDKIGTIANLVIQISHETVQNNNIYFLDHLKNCGLVSYIADLLTNKKYAVNRFSDENQGDGISITLLYQQILKNYDSDADQAKRLARLNAVDSKDWRVDEGVKKRGRNLMTSDEEAESVDETAKRSGKPKC
jgi:hypothetical protein